MEQQKAQSTSGKDYNDNLELASYQNKQMNT